MLIWPRDLGDAMKYLRYLAIACAVAASGTGSALANCGAAPEPPELPNGVSAQPEEMRKALDAAGTFSIAVKNYADCLIGAAQAAEDERDRLIEAAQAAMDERNALVERWNTEAESFMARLAD